MIKKASYIIICCVLIAFWGCNLSTPVEESGSITFSISGFAPWVVIDKSDQESSIEKSSKAWMVANTVKVELYQSTTIVKTASWTENDVIDTNDLTITKTITGITAGNYSKAVVSIYNSAVSTSTPTVQGTSATFTVTVNTHTPVSVTCIPTSTVNLEDGYYSSTYTLAANGEKWFKADSDYDPTTFYIKSVSGDMDLYIFKPNGTYLGRITGTDAINYADFATPSNPYYVCMYAFSAGSGQVGFGNPNGSVDLTIN